MDNWLAFGFKADCVSRNLMKDDMVVILFKNLLRGPLGIKSNT